MFGKVTNIADYGAFVEIEDGVEGLVHVSEMDWTNKNVNPAKVVHSGQEVEVMVLDVDEERRRISLGLKQCKQNPWKEFSENFNRGDKVSGQIKSITDFGVFIGLAGNIDGLVHLSDLSWDVAGEEAVRNYQKGQQVEAMVLSIDPERERISLGIKQLAQDPFSEWIATNPKGTIVKGVGQGSGRARRDHRPRQRHRRPAARQRPEPRSRRRRAHRAQGRPGNRSPVHGCRSQDPHDCAVHQGEGNARRGRGGIELPFRAAVSAARAWAICSRNRSAAIVSK